MELEVAMRTQLYQYLIDVDTTVLSTDGQKSFICIAI